MEISRLQRIQEHATLPVNISLCQTDPATGQCISAIGSSVTTTINANATPTFGVFVQGNDDVPFDPATNRIFVRFKDSGRLPAAQRAWLCGRTSHSTRKGKLLRELFTASTAEFTE